MHRQPEFATGLDLPCPRMARAERGLVLAAMLDHLPDLASLVLEFNADVGALNRRYATPETAERRARFASLYVDWSERIAGLPFEELARPAQVDAILFQNLLTRRTRQLELDAGKEAEVAAYLPFLPALMALENARRDFADLDPSGEAAVLSAALAEAKGLMENLKPVEASERPAAFRAASQVEALRSALGEWHRFGAGYHPAFTWWCGTPFRELDQALEAYGKALKETGCGVKPGDDDAIVGNPVGREALVADLETEWIPYSPEELIAIGDREYAWCEGEMVRAAAELGFQNWRDAVEHVKGLHVPPGEQASLVRDLAWEAIEFLERHDLVTVPELAKETWRMSMMPAERQKVAPFFLGGEEILVSFPTDAMPHETKLMSLRGNNRHFARATVQHELIPGHHLQFFMLQRHRPYRQAFGTPFWIEGWALWWEMLLWEQGFARSAEDRIGMLFWRMHRCARISFSLRFHLGEMSPEACIAFLVERVGHERANAEGEVRRSFSGMYPPLYQLAYMIGGLQMRALHGELVAAGWTPRRFHDAVLRENQMPLEVLRAELTEAPLSRDMKSKWRFAG